MRFGIAFALLLGVFVALYVAPALRNFSHQLGGYHVPPTGDGKSLFHAEGQ